MKRFALITSAMLAGVIILAFTACTPSIDLGLKSEPEIINIEAGGAEPIVEYNKEEVEDNVVILSSKGEVEVAPKEDNGIADAENIEEKDAIAAMVGTWKLEKEQDDNSFKAVGTMTVSADGTYKYVADDKDDVDKIHEGKITKGVEEYDGFNLQFISFTDNNGDLWAGCYIPATDPDVYYIGNGGVSRFTRVK